MSRIKQELNIKQGAGWSPSLVNRPRRQRQGGRQKTKGLMSRTKAVHARYKSLNISKPTSLCITTT